jgi:hypothetical protein
MATPGQASIASVSSDAQTSAERAGAVLRAARAAAAAAHGAPAAEPPPATPDHRAQLQTATGELDAHLAQAHARLDALERAIAELRDR